MVKKFFNIEMLPARHGDCLWIEYGAGKSRSLLLIDGGPIEAFDSLSSRIDAEKEKPKFDLVVLSHVDTDHIDGLVRLFAEKPLRLGLEQVWFNGWKHLNEKGTTLGGLQGEYLSALLAQRLPKSKWNAATKGKAVVVEDKGELPVFKLAGGMTITLLSPTRKKLETLRKDWSTHVATKNVTPGDLDKALKILAKDKRYLPDGELVLGASKDFNDLLRVVLKQDTAAANGSSIAFLAEYGGHSCLFLADAHPEVVTESLKRLLKSRGEKLLKVDATKLAHHGSKNNTNAALLKLIDSKYFLVSSNGAKFKHPDKETIAHVVDTSDNPVLCFNYETDFNKMWFDSALQKQLKFSTMKPTKTGIRLALADPS